MTSPRLQILQRQMARQSPEKIPAPDTSGLGAAIEQMIQATVEERVKESLEQQQPRSPRVRELMRQFDAPVPTKQIPPTPRAIQPKAMELSFQRDELGRINLVNMGNTQFRVQRNELGEIVRLVPADIAPVLPAIEPPFPGAPR